MLMTYDNYKTVKPSELSLVAVRKAWCYASLRKWLILSLDVVQFISLLE